MCVFPYARFYFFGMNVQYMSRVCVNFERKRLRNDQKEAYVIHTDTLGNHF